MSPCGDALNRKTCKRRGYSRKVCRHKADRGDERVLKALALTEPEKQMLEQIICQMEQERGLDRAAAIADMRFSFIKNLVEQCVVKPKESRGKLKKQSH